MYDVLHLTRPGMQRGSKMRPMVAEDTSPRQLRIFFPDPQRVIAPLALCCHSLLDKADDPHKNSTTNAGASYISNDTTNIEAPPLGASAGRPPEHTERTQ